MANDYYTHDSYPADAARATAARHRAAMEAIEFGFNACPALTGHGNEIVFVATDESGLTSSSALQFNGTVLTLNGTLAGTGLTITSPTLTDPILTTPTISGATVNTSTAASPSLTTPTITGGATISEGAGTVTGSMFLHNPTSVARLVGTGGGTDGNAIQFEQNAGDLHLSLVNDAGDTTTPVMTVTRSGMTVVSTDFVAGSVTRTGPAVLAATIFEEVIVSAAVNTVYSFTHGLGAVPSEVWAVMRCKNAANTYSVGDEANFTFYSGDVSLGHGTWADATNVAIQAGAFLLSGTSPPNTDEFVVNFTNWNIVLRYRE